MPQVKIHADKYEVLIKRRGRLVKWQAASICPCWSMASSQPTYQCAACHGKGYIYATPVTDVALLMSVTHSEHFDEMAGVFEVGDAVMTVGKRVPEIAASGVLDTSMKSAHENPIFQVGIYDLITLTDDEYKTSEILVKGTPIYGRAADTLLNEDVTSIQRIYTVDTTTGVVTDYVKGTDFEDSTSSTIQWIAGANAPAAGEQYSVVYTHRPVFTVLTTLPTQRHQDGQDLPRQVALRYVGAGMKPVVSQ